VRPPRRGDRQTPSAFGVPAAGSASYCAFKRADQTALLLEAQALLDDHGAGVSEQLKRDGVDLNGLASQHALERPWTPAQAEAEFLAAHHAAMASAA
jgi:hypothetical protein